MIRLLWASQLKSIGNAGGEYDLRYDYLCTFCFMFMSGVGAN